MPSEKIPLYALLVGINSHPSAALPSLRGAVADTLDFKKYLETELAVPSEQIVVLTESKATRTAVIDALAAFGADKRIEKGDAILIYYAGHGTELDPPTEWRVDGDNDKIQAIVPYDCNSGETVGTVPPIPDYTLEVLLSRIAREKGDNITVVFDCCHSASGTRGSRAVDSDTAVHVRSAELASFVWPDNLDEDIVSDGARGAFVAPKYRMRGLGSHTLLSACGKLEQAREERGHGRFSTSLLKLLRQVSPENLRHSEILSHALFPRIPNQNPQCEGIYKDRTLFNRKVLPAQRKSFAIQQTRGGYSISAGTIHRITEKSEFDVYRKTDITLSTRIGILVAEQVSPFSSTAQLLKGTPKLDLTQPAIAVIKKFTPQEFRIRIPAGNGFSSVYHELLNSRKQEFDMITLVHGVQSEAHAEVLLTDDDRIVFKFYTGRRSGDNLDVAENSIDNDLDDLARVLAAAIHFYSEFENHYEDVDISQNVAVEIYRLVDDHTMGIGAFSLPRMRPIGPNLNEDGVVNVHTQYSTANQDDFIPYGIRIVNQSGGDLYANLFYFSHGDLSIFPCAMSFDSGHHTLDVPLRKNGGALAIGFGDSGYPPVSFIVADGLDFEVGFFKVYLTTEAVDLSYIQQDTPFIGSRRMQQYKPRTKVAWTDIVVQIIQYREPLALDMQTQN